ncbi:M48 family metalloprotease [Anaerocolumna sedimenticola]|uniref:M48 family metalloprotease n=1 Tax=Anaerocolumna sedimenticola TaxID=2696063 RepID=A0A6P1TKU4_9FIRM|nr:M56 family metallopeptidase [Anaerocolumna sedimenticola]QHQ60759.1 M48 family metalloprotease [Anaerocolumna sedimenticola]
MINLLVLYFTNSLNITFFILLMLLIEPFLKKYFSAICLYRVWVILMIGLLIPIRFEFSKALFYISSPRITVEDKTYESNMPGTQESNENPDAADLSHKQPNNQHSRSIYFFKELLSDMQSLVIQYKYLLLCLIWIIGITLMLVINSIRYFRLIKLLKRYFLPINQTDIQQKIIHCMNSLNNNYSRNINTRFTKYCKINIFKCALISNPMTIGIFRPTILLPDESYTEKDLHFILGHELVHIHRKDSLVKLVRLIVQVLNWYNPFCYVLARHIDDWCEISCDEMVLRKSTKADCLDYGKLLLKCAAALPKQNTVSLMNLYGGKNNMKHRLNFILDHRKKHAGKLLLALSLSVIFTTVIVATGKDVLASDKNVKITGDLTTIQLDEKDKNNTVDNTAVTPDSSDSGNNMAKTNQYDSEVINSEDVSNTDTLRNDVVNYAKQAEGIPYIWGGNDLKTGVDCSGFVQAVYKKVGYDLPRTSEEQEKVSNQVSMDNLLPGDLIFYADSNDNTIGHVGIYIGDNKVIHAKNLRVNVVIEDMNYRPPYSAGRIINN